MKIDEEIKNKQASIANLERILETYRGRWYDLGRRDLQKLKDELAVLEQKKGQ